MHPHYQRYFTRRRTLRWLLFGVLPLLLLFLILHVTFFGVVAPFTPWVRQSANLKGNHRFILDYQIKNKRWPTTYDDIAPRPTDRPNPSEHRALPFIDPDTHQSAPWLLFDPAHVKPLPQYGRIIAAAPRIGGYRKGEHEAARLVLFENGVTLWIPDSDFRSSTGR